MSGEAFLKDCGFCGFNMESSGVSAVYIERLKLNYWIFGMIFVDYDFESADLSSIALLLSRKLG